MSKPIDLTGQRFGRLVVIEKAETKNGIVKWKCLCDCGNEKIATGRDLKRGSVKSCGCYRHDFRHKDLTGQTFGKLKVIERVSINGGHGSTWLCQCECGNTITVRRDGLTTGHTTSCGCYAKSGDAHRQHGMTGTKLHRTWMSMRARCRNRKFKQYKDYGARGIAVCDEWNGEHGFVAFMEWALDNGYSDELTIDRIDNDKGYSPENCRWVTMAEQALNKRSNHYITFEGKTQTLKEWADEKNMKYGTLSNRFKKGWSVEDALTRPVDKKFRRKIS